MLQLWIIWGRQVSCVNLAYKLSLNLNCLFLSDACNTLFDAEADAHLISFGETEIISSIESLNSKVIICRTTNLKLSQQFKTC